MISVIIPVYNRRVNLRYVLHALTFQQNRDFEVVVADDGSSEDMLSVVKAFEVSLHPRYVRWAHNGFQAGAVRNLGCKIASGEAYLFLDSDIILNPVVLAHYSAFHKANPDVIIAGRYDWLPPTQMDMRVCEQIVGGDLSKLKQIGVDGAIGYIGEDPRLSLIQKAFESEEPCSKVATFLYSGNLLVPKRIFWGLGGFDEGMVGHGGEDCEFGIRVQKSGHKTIFSNRLVGYHLWHPRDQEANRQSLWINVAYIERKHNLEEVGLYRWSRGEDTGILPKGMRPQ